MTEKLKKAAVWILLTAGALVMMFPFIWMLATSLKTLPEATAIPPTLFPAKAVFANYAEAFTMAPFGRYLFNSILVAGLGTLLTLVITVLAAYAFTVFEFPGKSAEAFTMAPFGRYLFNSILVAGLGTLLTLVITVLAAYAFTVFEFPGKSSLFFCCLATMMIPAELLIIQNFITVSKLHWVNTFQGIIIPTIARPLLLLSCHHDDTGRAFDHPEFYHRFQAPLGQYLPGYHHTDHCQWILYLHDAGILSSNPFCAL